MELPRGARQLRGRSDVFPAGGATAGGGAHGPSNAKAGGFHQAGDSDFILSRNGVASPGASALLVEQSPSVE
jgi:hypothetical protein